jgi:hypothetical protein
MPAGTNNDENAGSADIPVGKLAIRMMALPAYFQNS